MNNLKVKIPTPIDWPTMAINHVCSLVSRGTAPIYVTNSSIYAIGQRCVQISGFDQSVARPHNETKLERVLWAKQGDILLNSTGTGTIGRSCIFTAENNAYIVDGHVTLIRPDNKQLDARWLNTFFQSYYGQSHLEIYCYSGSTNQIELSRKALVTSYIPLPPSSEQQYIANILDTLDTQIQQTEQLIAKLKQIKFGLLHDLLTRGIDEHGEWRDPVAHPEQFKDSVVGRIPEKWRIDQLGKISTQIVDGTHFTPTYVDNGIPFLRVTDIQNNGEMNFDRVKKIPEHEHKFLSKRCKPEFGDVLYSKNGTVGIPRLVDWHTECSIFVSLCLIKPIKSLVEPAYLTEILQSFYVQKQIRIRAKLMTVSNLHLEEIREFCIPLPNLEEQYKIMKIINESNALVYAEETNLAKLKQLKKGLMHDLLTGRVRVTQLLPESEQPGSQLKSVSGCER